MTARIRRGRRRVTCTHCGRTTITRHPTTSLCARCRTTPKETA